MDFLPALRTFSWLALVWGFISNIIASCYVMFGWHLWEACSFVKRNKEGVDLGREKVGVTGRSTGREGCGGVILCEGIINRRRNKSISLPYKKSFLQSSSNPISLFFWSYMCGNKGPHFLMCMNIILRKLPSSKMVCQYSAKIIKWNNVFSVSKFSLCIVFYITKGSKQKIK